MLQLQHGILILIIIATRSIIVIIARLLHAFLVWIIIGYCYVIFIFIFIFISVILFYSRYRNSCGFDRTNVMFISIKTSD